MTLEEKLKQKLAVLKEVTEKQKQVIEFLGEENSALLQKKNEAEARIAIFDKKLLNSVKEDYENKKLKDALLKIKDIIESSQDKKYLSYFDLDAKDAVFILDTIENALLWSPK